MVKCPNCGAANPDTMKYCGNCGKSLAVTPMASSEMRQRQCVSCGRSINWDANVCMYCGHDYRAKPPKAGTEGHLLTGSVLTLLAGVLGIVLLTVIVSQWGNDEPFPNIAFATISFVCCILGVIGGYLGLARRNFPIAVLGAACAIFSPAFFFAIPGLVLIGNSAAKFKDYVPGQ